MQDVNSIYGEAMVAELEAKTDRGNEKICLADTPHINSNSLTAEYLRKMQETKNTGKKIALFQEAMCLHHGAGDIALLWGALRESNLGHGLVEEMTEMFGEPDSYVLPSHHASPLRLVCWNDDCKVSTPKQLISSSKWG